MRRKLRFAKEAGVFLVLNTLYPAIFLGGAQSGDITLNIHIVGMVQPSIGKDNLVLQDLEVTKIPSTCRVFPAEV